MEIGTTIRKLRKEKGLTLNQLAAITEGDVGNLSRLERGMQGYSDAMIKKIADALDVPVAFLFLEADHLKPLSQGGTTDHENIVFMSAEDHGNFHAKTPLLQRMSAALQGVHAAVKDDPDFVQIPMVKLRLQAGVTGFQTEPERRDGGTLGMRRNWLERKGFDPAKLYAIQVRGASMEPALYEDDIVVINVADTKLVDGEVYAFNYEGEAVVKRLSRDAGMWWLTSDNLDKSKYHRKSVQGDDCIVIGRVVRKESDRI